MPYSDLPSPRDRSDVDFYRISLLGRLPEDMFDLFSPMLVKTVAGQTVLLGPVQDQSALQGLLFRIQSLGLELEEVKRVRSSRESTRGDLTPPAGYAVTDVTDPDANAEAEVNIEIDVEIEVEIEIEAGSTAVEPPRH